jgi:hypothetical protein
MNIIDTILSREEFRDDPPVLMDIGASGNIHPEWKEISKYSVCIAFDPDEREMGYTTNLNSSFRKLLVIPSIVTERDENSAKFYLTKSPYCSSLLEPDKEALRDWVFSDLFEVNEIKTLNATTISATLKMLDRKSVV